MARYSKEQKEAMKKRMMPPENMSIPKLSKETGITVTTLYNWRKELRASGKAAPCDEDRPDSWSSRDKFLIVHETYTMNEEELARYCREKGLFVEQVISWQNSCEEANDGQSLKVRELMHEVSQVKKDHKKLEQELRRKDKALAEAAALLVLRKKVQAIWGENEDD
ncbi:MAG: transposase [Synergistota bacterium]|nr:transposase [Synergistota bacterium]